MSALSIDQAIALALQHHQAGRLKEAEPLYQQVLAQQPNHPDALHYLGVLAHQAGRSDIALDLIGKAIQHNSSRSDYYSNFGSVLENQGQLDRAIVAYRKAIQLQPEFAEAYFNLGNVLRKQGQLDQAISAYRSAIRLNPDHAAAQSNLGIALSDQGQFDQAIIAYRNAIQLKPDLAESHNNLGRVLKKQGQLDQAIVAYRKAIKLKPESAEAHNNLGNVLRDQRQLDEAVAAYGTAIRLKPDYADAYSNLGTALADQDQLDQAVAAYRKAIQLKPDSAETHNNLGHVLKKQGQLDQALVAFRKAIQLKPDYAEAHNSLGEVFRDQNLTDRAIEAYRSAIRLKLDYAEAYGNLGTALADQGQLDEAISTFRTAIQLKPDYAEAYNNLGNALKHQGLLEQAISAFNTAIQFKPDLERIFSNLFFTRCYQPEYDAAAVAEEARQWNERFAAPLKPLIQPHLNDRSPERRLRIGYVSADFRLHVVARFLQPLLAAHDHQNFEIFAYAQVPTPDAVTHQLQAHVDCWRSIVGVSDEQVVEMIRRDSIDILVDLGGHTANNRLWFFARKPAPVQVTYLGFPLTTGLEAIDYRLTDAFADPPGQTESYHSEKLIRLPATAWCYHPGSSPAPTERQAGPITFGSFNSFAKVTEPMLQRWAEILLAVPESRLLLKAAGLGSETVRERVRKILSESGIVPERLELLYPEATHAAHIAHYRKMDIALDTFPYHGTTTTCEALWEGVPVVSLAGKSHVSRVGVSLLSNVGLPDLVAHSVEEYRQIAVNLANDLPRLANLRSTLRQRMEASPLMDAPRFTRHIEAAYRQMWRTWCEQALQESAVVL